MRRREEQVAIQNAGKIEARKREDLLEQERATAEKKLQLEEQQKNKNEKRRRVREEWQRQTRLVEEEKKKEDKIQFDKSLAKDMTSAELYQEVKRTKCSSDESEYPSSGRSDCWRKGKREEKDAEEWSNRTEGDKGGKTDKREWLPATSDRHFKQ